MSGENKKRSVEVEEKEEREEKMDDEVEEGEDGGVESDDVSIPSRSPSDLDSGEEEGEEEGEEGEEEGEEGEDEEEDGKPRFEREMEREAGVVKKMFEGLAAEVKGLDRKIAGLTSLLEEMETDENRPHFLEAERTAVAAARSEAEGERGRKAADLASKIRLYQESVVELETAISRRNAVLRGSRALSDNSSLMDIFARNHASLTARLQQTRQGLRG